MKAAFDHTQTYIEANTRNKCVACDKKGLWPLCPSCYKYKQLLIHELKTKNCQLRAKIKAMKTDHLTFCYSADDVAKNVELIATEKRIKNGFAKLEKEKKDLQKFMEKQNNAAATKSTDTANNPKRGWLGLGFDRLRRRTRSVVGGCTG